MWGANPHQPISCDITQDSATHGTKNMIANRRMAVSERSAVGRAIAVGYVAGSIPAVPMWLDSYQLAGDWRMPCEDKNHHAWLR